MKIFNHWIAKIGLILISLLLALSCNTQDEKVVNNQPEPLQGQILLWSEMPRRLTEAQSSGAQKVLKDLIGVFSELHPQVQVFVEFRPASQIWEQFESQVNRGAGPDMLIVRASPEIAQLIQMKALRAIKDSEINRPQFRSEGLKQVSYQDRIYGFPLYLSTQVLCYNKNKVNKLPRTLTELIKQARKGYSVGLKSSFDDTFWGVGIFGGQLFDDRGRSILAQGGGWARWMKWLKEARNQPNFILSDNAEALRDAFVEGKLAYLTCETNWIAYFKEELGPDRLGATLLPGEADHPATPILESSVLLFNRASNANQHRLALELAEFLTNVEQQKQAKAATPLIPSNLNVTIDEELFPLRTTLRKQAKTGVSLALDDAAKLELIANYGNILYRQVLNGALAPEEAAAQLDRAVNRQFESE